MEVVKRLSETAYGVRETNSGQYFERTICNISPFRAPVAPESGPASAPGPRVGNTGGGRVLDRRSQIAGYQRARVPLLVNDGQERGDGEL